MIRSTQSINPLLNLPVHQHSLATRTTSLLPTPTLTKRDQLSSSLRENIVSDLALVQAISSTSTTPRSQKFTPSLALRHLTLPESICRPSEIPLINASEGEWRRPSFSSSDTIYLPEAYSSPSHDDISGDDGDPRHEKVLYLSLTMKVQNFIKKEDLNINLGDV